MDTSPSFDECPDRAAALDEEVSAQMSADYPAPERLDFMTRATEALPFWTLAASLRYGLPAFDAPTREVEDGRGEVVAYDISTFTREMSDELAGNRLVCDPDEDAA